jgi:hypothetical protein
MIELIPIEVECHSGYKADEYPKCFYRDDERFEIQEITDRWYQGNRDPKFPVSNYFKVKTDSGEMYLIKHDLDRDEWYLCQSS